MSLTRQEKTAAQAIFTTRPDRPCEFCGGYHLRQGEAGSVQKVCPRIKRMVFHPNGNLIEVEYWQHGHWDETGVIWPEDAFDPEDSAGSRE